MRAPKNTPEQVVQRIATFDAAVAAGCRRVISAGVICAFLDFSRRTFDKHVESGVWGTPFTLSDGPTSERYVLFDTFKAWLDQRIANTANAQNVAAARAQSLLRRRP